MDRQPVATIEGPWSSLPFAGLGMDLGSVAAEARTLTLRPLIRPDEGMNVIMPPLPPRNFGYELLVALGREIRGR